MSVYGSQTVAPTDEGGQQQKLHVIENNWVRRISRTKGVDRRRMNDPWEGIAMPGSFTGRWVRGQMTWAERLIRMDVDRPQRGTEAEKRQLRPQETNKITAEIGDVCKERVGKSEEEERFGNGAANRNQLEQGQMCTTIPYLTPFQF